MPVNVGKWSYTLMHLTLNLEQDGGSRFPKNDALLLDH